MISQNLLSFFKNYIALDTSLPSGEHYAQAIDLLEAQMKSFGFKTQTVPIPQKVSGKPNRINLIARRSSTDPKAPTLLIYHHIDVVPAAYKDAFKLKVDKGKFYGRGSSDMKGCTLAILSALEVLKTKDLRFHLIVIFTTDEETDQLTQLRYLHPKLKLPRGAIVIDPDTFAGGISVAHLGLLQLQIIVKGKSAHSGMRHLGKNAIEDAAKLVLFLQTIQTEYEQKFSTFTAPKSAGIKHPCNRLNVNLISGGMAPNAIPDRCVLTVDCRYIPESDVSIEEKILHSRIKQFAREHHISLELTTLQLIEGYATDHAITRELSEVYKNVAGATDVFCVLGSTPLSQWTKDLKLAHIGLGVTQADNHIHGVDEFCYQRDIEEVADTYARFLKK